MVLKNRTTRKRQRPATTSSSNNSSTGNANEVELNDCGESERLGWASVPGTKLDVDIANINDDDFSKKKKRTHSTVHSSNHTKGGTPPFAAAAAADQEDDDEKYDTSKWKSYHYDNEELNDDTDLYNPDRLDNSNKFDVGGLMEGANDAGMFLR